MFNKILIVLSIVMLTQLGSAAIATPSQIAQGAVESGLIVQADTTPSGGYSILVVDLVQGYDYTPNQAFAIAAGFTAILMDAEDNHNAVSVIGVSTTDGKISYFEMNQVAAEGITAALKENGASVLGLMYLFNGLPQLG